MAPELPVLMSQRLSRRRGQTSRLLAAILLGLQALLWGGGSIIEARTAAESLTRYAHVEDTGTTKCPPIHNDVDCLICRTLSSGATAGSAPSVVPLATSATCRAEGIQWRADQTCCLPVGSRAPPLA